MRRAAKVDANHGAVVRALRAAGASVWSTAPLGRGFPDLCVGYRGRNYLLEVKDGRKPPSARRLMDDQQAFFREWRGAVVVVESVEEALRAVGAG